MSKTRGARGARGLRSKYRRRPRQLGWAATWKLRRGPCRGPAGRSATVCASAHDARGVTVGWHTKAARHARDGGNAAQEERRAGRGRGRPGRRNERGEGGRAGGARVRAGRSLQRRPAVGADTRPVDFTADARAQRAPSTVLVPCACTILKVQSCIHQQRHTRMIFVVSKNSASRRKPCTPDNFEKEEEKKRKKKEEHGWSETAAHLFPKYCAKSLGILSVDMTRIHSRACSERRRQVGISV